MAKLLNYFVIMLILFMLIPLQVHAQVPAIDGSLKDSIWNDAAKYEVEMTNGVTLMLKIYSTSNDLFIGAELPHNGPDDEIEFNTSVPHDYFGVEFDINFDNAIMGTPSSPDDLMMIDYDQPGYRDMFMHSFKAFTDVENGGTDDGAGESGQFNGTIVWEFRKPLISDDDNGYDISLKTGDEFRIMLGFWDDKPIHTAAAFTNAFNEQSLFMSYYLGEVRQRFLPNAVVGVFIIVAGMATYYTERIVQKNQSV